MDRTLITWTIPNMITIPLMAFATFLLVGIVYQLVKGQMGGQGGDNASVVGQPFPDPSVSGFVISGGGNAPAQSW